MKYYRCAPDICRRPETLSATVVRNILTKVRDFNNSGSFNDIFCFRHGRYEVCAVCNIDRCKKLVVHLYHRAANEIWIISPDNYPLLPSEAFEL